MEEARRKREEKDGNGRILTGTVPSDQRLLIVSRDRRLSTVNACTCTVIDALHARTPCAETCACTVGIPLLCTCVQIHTYTAPCLCHCLPPASIPHSSPASIPPPSCPRGGTVLLKGRMHCAPKPQAVLCSTSTTRHLVGSFFGVRGCDGTSVGAMPQGSLQDNKDHFKTELQAVLGQTQHAPGTPKP